MASTESETVKVYGRVEQNSKEQTEAILDQPGIFASAFINMTDRQGIMSRGIPLDVTLPKEIPVKDAYLAIQKGERCQMGHVRAYL